MFYADLIGPDKVLSKLKEFEATMGDDFKPAALLEKVGQVLAGAGYHILAAADGNEALQLNIENSGPIHLLLTDVVMPDLSGYELAERLRIARPQMKVLYMSGYPDLGNNNEAIETGLKFISKPFTKEKLLRRIRELIDT